MNVGNSLQKAMLKDPLSSNVFVAIALLFYESLWLGLVFDSGYFAWGHSIAENVLIACAAVAIVVTVPYLWVCVLLASRSTKAMRRWFAGWGWFLAGSCLAIVGAAHVESRGKWAGVDWISKAPFGVFGALIALQIVRTRLFFSPKAQMQVPTAV